MSAYTHKRIAGLSLVELMVAIVISSVLLLGISSVYLSSRRSNTVQDALARLQENGRFAISSMTKDIRMAGYQGCTNIEYLTPSNIVAGSGGGTDATYNVLNNTYITGHTCSSGSCSPAAPAGITPLSGTDAITIQSAAGCSATLTGNMGVANANIQMQLNSCGFQANDVLFITDCQNADVFRANNVNNGSIQVIAHSNSVNTSNFLSKAYDQRARVMSYGRHTFYIANGANGGPSLFRGDYKTDTDTVTPVELVEDVDNMTILYGVDQDKDATKSVDTFLTATQVEAKNLWSQVQTVELHLLLSTKQNAAKSLTPYRYMGVMVTPSNTSDRRYRREFTISINIRNKTP